MSRRTGCEMFIIETSPWGSSFVLKLATRAALSCGRDLKGCHFKMTRRWGHWCPPRRPATSTCYVFPPFGAQDQAKLSHGIEFPTVASTLEGSVCRGGGGGEGWDIRSVS